MMKNKQILILLLEIIHEKKNHELILLHITSFEVR